MISGRVKNHEIPSQIRGVQHNCEHMSSLPKCYDLEPSVEGYNEVTCPNSVN
jgi:hypothetical protein